MNTAKYRKIGKINMRQELLISLSITILGAVLGVIAKAADSTTLLGDIGTDLSIWILLGTLIAAYSRHPAAEGTNAMLFFLVMSLAQFFM